jgi:hypothetical protein
MAIDCFGVIDMRCFLSKHAQIRQVRIRRFGLSGENQSGFQLRLHLVPEQTEAPPAAAMSSTNGAGSDKPAVPAFNMSLKAKGTKAKPARKVAAAVHAHADDDDEDGDVHNVRREFVTSVAAGEVHGTTAKEEKQLKVIPLSVNPWEQPQQAAAAVPAVVESAEKAVAAKTLDELAAEALSREAAEEQARSQGRRSGDAAGNNMGMDSTRVIKLQVCFV